MIVQLRSDRTPQKALAGQSLWFICYAMCLIAQGLAVTKIAMVHSVMNFALVNDRTITSYELTRSLIRDPWLMALPLLYGLMVQLVQRQRHYPFWVYHSMLIPLYAVLAICSISGSYLAMKFLAY